MLWIKVSVQHLLSLVGSVFFSFVSVFFSLLLSNFSTSEMSGLSDMTAKALKQTNVCSASMDSSQNTPVCGQLVRSELTELEG